MKRIPLLALTILAFAYCAAGADPGVTLPAIVTDKLDNGLEIILLRTKAVPLVTIEVAAKTGSFIERKDNNGLSHLYEHMFFKGNAALADQTQYKERIRQLGIVYNGTTNAEGVLYFFTLPSRNLEPGMEFMAQALLTPKFDKQELEKERKVVLGEYDRNEATPGFKLNRALTETLFWKFPWRKNPIGARDVVSNATVDQMLEFRNIFYIPNNCALIVVGDFDLDQARALAHKHFGAWKAGPNPHQPPREPHPHVTESKAIIVNEAVRFATLHIQTYGPNVSEDPDATYAADVFGTMVGMATCRFQKKLVESQLAGAAGMGYYTQNEGGELSVYAQLAPQNVIPARDALFTEIAAMADPRYFTADELANAKHGLVLGRLFDAEAGQDYARNLAFWWVVGGIDYYRGYLEHVDRVTLEDVNRFVKKYVLGKPYVMGLMISAEAQTKLGLTDKSFAGPAHLGEVSGGAPAAAAEETAQFAVPAQEGAQVPVIFKPVRENDVVSVQVFVRGGSLNVADDKAGVENLLLETMILASARYPREKLQEEMSRMGMSLAAESSYDYSVVTLKFLAQDAERALDILHDLLQAPSLAAEDLEEARQQLLQTLQREESDPDQEVRYVANAGLFAGHAYLRRPKGSLATVPKLTREDLLAHREKVLRSSRVLAVVVGNLARAQVEKQLGAALGWLPKGDAAPAAPAFPAAGQGSVHVEDKEIPTAYILAKFAIPGPADPDYPAVMLGLQTLSERLEQVIRTEHALSYAVNASSAMYRANFGYLYVTTTDPKQTLDLMFAEVEKLRTEPVSADYLRQVAGPLFTEFFMRDETNAGQAGSLGHAELSGVGWKNARAVADKLFEITPEQVQKAMGTWLHHFHFGIIGPQKWIDNAQVEKYAK